MDSSTQITLTVDGFAERYPAGLDLATLLRLRGDPAGAAVVEHNGTYVPATALERTILSDGDRVEIILPAFGG